MNADLIRYHDRLQTLWHRLVDMLVRLEEGFGGPYEEEHARGIAEALAVMESLPMSEVWATALAQAREPVEPDPTIDTDVVLVRELVPNLAWVPDEVKETAKNV